MLRDRFLFLHGDSDWRIRLGGPGGLFCGQPPLVAAQLCWCAGVSIQEVVYLWERWGENRFGIDRIRNIVGLN
jgi:hypothetical protein